MKYIYIPHFAKAMSIVAALLLLIASCVGKTEEDESGYELKETTTHTYQYEYVDSKIKKVLHTISTERFVRGSKEISSLYYDDYYYYDQRDSMQRIESYTAYSDHKELSMVEKYSDKALETVNLYPNGDTSAYRLSIKDELGREMDTYTRVNLMSVSEEDNSEYMVLESTFNNEYEGDRFSRTVYADLTEQTQEVRTYRYKTSGDTLVTEVRLDGFLEQRSKKFPKDKFMIEAIEYFDYAMKDSIFSLNGKDHTFISHDATSKRVTKSDYNERGDIVKSVNEVWILK